MVAYQDQDKLLGLPLPIRPRWLIYNQTAFAQAGLQPPSPTWTPDDFLAAAQVLTQGEGERKHYGYVPLADPARDLLFFIGQFGGRLTRGSGSEARPNFDDPLVVRAIQWYIDLSRVHKVMPPLVFPYRRGQPLDDQSSAIIRAGRAAMWFDLTTQRFEPQGFTLGIAMPPLGKGSLSGSDFTSQGLFISASSAHATPCWKWISFLSGDSATARDGIPARASVATSDGFLGGIPAEQSGLYKAYVDRLKRAEPIDETLVLRTIDLYWFYLALDHTLADHADLARELDAAQRTTSAVLDCLDDGGTAAACALQVDPTYQGYNVEVPGGGTGSG